MKALLLPLMLAASPALADEFSYDFATSFQCADKATDWGDKLACIGAASTECMESTPAGYSTYGQLECYSRELQDWDAELNALYGPLVARLTEEGTPETGFDPVNQGEALRDAQRAWITWRDANCLFERSQWGGGTGGGPAEVYCHLHMTAERVFSLRALVEMH